MSAKVSELYEARCDECRMSSWPEESEAIAESWAATHNAEHHETDNSTDEAYERFKEARYGD